jgi:ribosomal protein S18 acetylase RimI-like enzyme
MMQTRIRPAVDDDGEALSLLGAEIQAMHAGALPWRFKPPAPDTFPPEAAIALLGLPENHFFVAEVDGSAVGYVYAETVKQSETAAKYAFEVVYVHHLYVRPAFRRRGIGRALLDAVRTVGAEQGIARLALDVWTFNEEARTFFRGYGLKSYNERLWNG